MMFEKIQNHEVIGVSLKKITKVQVELLRRTFQLIRNQQLQVLKGSFNTI